MKRKIKYKKNSHQEEFHDDDKTKFLHLSCGFGGGKTYSLVMKHMKLSFLNRHIAGGLVAPSFTDMRKDVIPTIEEICDDNRITYKHNKAEQSIVFPWSKGKTWLISAEKKIRGPNWGFASINEVTLISHQRYKEVIGRVRVKGSSCPQVISSGTPEGTGHWLYDALIENPMRNSKCVYGDTRNNIDNLDADYIQSLYDSYDAVMIDAYLKGLWVNMQGNRFYYSYDPDKCHDESIKHDPLMQNHVSLDFNVDPMAAAIWHYDGRRIYGFDQIKIMDGDTRKMAQALIARGYTPQDTIIYPDPSGNQRKTSNLEGRGDVKILREEFGFEVRVKKKAPLMRPRQLAMNNLLDKGCIMFNPKTCPDVRRDFAGVSQDVVTLGKCKKDMKLTHFSDGIDYMCDILFPKSGSKPLYGSFNNMG